jgi:hypothetical protein
MTRDAFETLTTYDDNRVSSSEKQATLENPACHLRKKQPVLRDLHAHYELESFACNLS